MISTAPKILSISIIIPVLNEELTIGKCLDRLQPYPDLEIIVVDGGSDDKTLDQISARKQTYLTSPPGRGTQQHHGAGVARGENLLFLHSDSQLPDNFMEVMQHILQQPGTVAGAFQLAINSRGFGYRLIEWGTNLRAGMLQLPYGDQALFMRRQVYEEVGGFPCHPILEDIALVARLKDKGTITLARSQVTTSARRWQQKGIIQTLLINQMMLVGWKMGISPQRLARWYYGAS